MVRLFVAAQVQRETARAVSQEMGHPCVLFEERVSDEGACTRVLNRYSRGTLVVL